MANFRNFAKISVVEEQEFVEKIKNTNISIL